MLFNSFVFLGFYLVVLLVYWNVRQPAQNWLLLFSSYVFYGYWDWRFLSLIWTSTLLDFVVSRRIAASSVAVARKRWLLVSVVANLGILGIFKYYGFFVESLLQLAHAVGLHPSIHVLRLILPLGISFYTFQTMSYTIDVYRGKVSPVGSLRDFALYVCFFPQLVAGPIERTEQLLPQIQGNRTLDRAGFEEGTYHILIGLLKKVVIADNLSDVVGYVFDKPAGELGWFTVLLGTYAFAFQIYGDFSGYSSIAQGVAKLLGFDLMYNFRMPYLARDPSDFWRRWHISLSEWLRDYLYIPLGGNRGSTVATYRNLMLTMVLGGLWHGAAWTFVVWGFLHGMYLALYRVMRWPSQRFTVVQVVVWFHAVCLAWVFFRAQGMEQALGVIRGLTRPEPWTPVLTGGFVLLAFFCVPLFSFEYWVHRRRDMLALLKVHWAGRGVAYAAMLFMISVFASTGRHEFIYFQF